jgi:DNA-binding transcriptional regulator YdaS (Cro superfamily)
MGIVSGSAQWIGDEEMQEAAREVTHVNPREMSNDELKSIAELAGISSGYMLLAGKYGYRRFSPELSIKIEHVTGGRIQKWMLRPDVWAPPSDYKFPKVRRYRKR